MKLMFFFLAASPLTAAAIPMMISFASPSAPSAPSASEHSGPNQTPKVDFGYRPMTRIERAAAKDLMIDHYNGLESGNDQKQARLAFAKNGWIDGVRLDDHHRQYLDFNYHRGDTPDSARIGQTVTLARDRPPPEVHFSNRVLIESKPDITKEMNKKYKALPPDMARRVRSMRAQNDWVEGPGLREQTQITFHDKPVPLAPNAIGKPVTIYRPMSFLMDGTVQKDHIPTIKKRVRDEHEKLDENHPLKQANFGVVTDGWHKKKGGKSLQVGTTLYKVKDRLSDSGDNFRKIGDFHVVLGRGQKAKTKGMSTSTRRNFQAGASVPDDTEAPSPDLS